MMCSGATLILSGWCQLSPAPALPAGPRAGCAGYGHPSVENDSRVSQTRLGKDDRETAHLGETAGSDKFTMLPVRDLIGQAAACL